MHRGEVHALLEKHEMQGVPHRGIEVNKAAEFLWWNSVPAGRGMLSHFPALKGVAYSNCHFLKKVSIPRQVKILMCFSKDCKCDFRTIMGQRRK
uniref:SCP domain-containing protein n=1 Tax=Strongyloides papillosus TaxID=174720 RepID=A0A0N5BEN8_STREA